MNNEDVAKKVMSQIQAALEHPEVWDNGRVDCFYPMNPVSKKTYHGVNVLILGVDAMFAGYKTPRYMTYNQAKNEGGFIKKGAKGNTVIFWKLLTRHRDDSDDDKIPLLKYYTVFNIDQISDLPEKFHEVKIGDAVALEEPDQIIDTYLDREYIQTEQCFGSPHYSPGTDIIGMPAITAFKTTERYYESFFHEMVHSTGHKTRLNRLELGGVSTYSREELVTEFGSAMLLAKTGTAKGYGNLAAYIKSWWGKIGEHPQDLISAAGKATHAVEYIEHGKVKEVAA